MGQKVFGIQEYEELASGNYAQVVASVMLSSGIKEYTIEGGSYSAYPVDLGAFYDIVRIYCADASYFAAGTYMAAYCSPSYPLWPMAVLHDQDDPGTVWAPSTSLPTSGAFDFCFPSFAGSRWVQLSLDAPPTDDVTFLLYAVHRSL
jgi:hypothetical protein